MCLGLLALQEALQLFNIFAGALSIVAVSSATAAAAAAILWVVFAADDNFEHLAKTATIKYA